MGRNERVKQEENKEEAGAELPTRGSWELAEG